LKDSIKNNFYLSLKPPAYNFKLEHVNNIAAVALKNGHGIHFDSHDHSLAEPTLQLLKRLVAHIGAEKDTPGIWHCGLTLPSRWKRSLSDARWAIKNRIRVRLVKGEFKARHSNDEMDPKIGFLALIDSLAGSVPEIAIATHDYRLAKEAIIQAGKIGAKVQLELLFGMPSTRMIALSKEMHVPLRFYVPYGDTLLLYGIQHHLTTPYKFVRPDVMEVFGGHKAKLSKIINSL
jgi:proline dehydrogenase